MTSPEAAPYTVQFFRNYGIHHVQGLNSVDHIASFPGFDELEDALESDLPDSGHIVTPEYIAGPADMNRLSESRELIQDRIMRARRLSSKTNAILHLGIPLYHGKQEGEEQWTNTVLSLHQGMTVSMAHKHTLLKAERDLGITTSHREQRTAMFGSAVLICAELYSSPPRMRRIYPIADFQQVLAPATWAIPMFEDDESRASYVKHAGGPDKYSEGTLRSVISEFTLPTLPDVQKVIVADRSLSDLEPYNAVFTRSA